MRKRHVLFTAMALSLPLAFWLAWINMETPKSLKGQVYLDGFCLNTWGGMCGCSNNVITCGSPGTSEAAAAYEVCNGNACDSQLDCSTLEGCTCAAWGGYDCPNVDIMDPLYEFYFFCGATECTPGLTDCPYHPPDPGYNSGCDQCCDWACNGNAACITACETSGGVEYECNTCCGGENSSTSSANVCGDGTKAGNEECDDGNTSNSDSCVSGCKSAKCGDGYFYEGSEQCDGGANCNQCSCTIGFEPDPANKGSCKPKCGDSLVVDGEDCDSGAHCTSCKCDTNYEPDPSTNDCRPKCGNGKKDNGEACDGGPGCETDCSCILNWQPDPRGGTGCVQCTSNAQCSDLQTCDTTNYTCICAGPNTTCCEDLATGNPDEGFTTGIGGNCNNDPICVWCSDGQGNPSNCSSVEVSQCPDCSSTTTPDYQNGKCIIYGRDDQETPFTGTIVCLQAVGDDDGSEKTCSVAPTGGDFDGGTGGNTGGDNPPPIGGGSGGAGGTGGSGGTGGNSSTLSAGVSSSKLSSGASSKLSSGVSSSASSVVSSQQLSSTNSSSVSSVVSSLFSSINLSSISSASQIASSQLSSTLSSVVSSQEGSDESASSQEASEDLLSSVSSESSVSSSSSDSSSTSTGSSLSSSSSSITVVIGGSSSFGIPDFSNGSSFSNGQSFSNIFNPPGVSSASSSSSLTVVLTDDSSSSSSSSSAIVGNDSSTRFGTYSSDDDEELPSLQLIDPCGNGTLDYGEECDDGNRANGDGCNALCVVERNLVAAASVCGDGQLEGNEECDDSNRRDNDGCSSNCQLEIGICGDGIIQSLLGEQCEQSTPVPDTVRCVRCRFVSLSCGDGTVDEGEECDEGDQNSTAPDANCRPDCSFARCGDNILDTGEECDDGNRLNGDGCDRFCATPTGSSSSSAPTQIAADTNQTNIPFSQQQPNVWPYGIQFPNQPNVQNLPYQLPLAQLQPLIQGQAPAGDTGPAAVAVIGAGSAAGFSYMRRKKRK